MTDCKINGNTKKQILTSCQFVSTGDGKVLAMDKETISIGELKERSPRTKTGTSYYRSDTVCLNVATGIKRGLSWSPS